MVHSVALLDQHEALQSRYTDFMSQRCVRDFLQSGGVVTIAAETRSYQEVAVLAQAGHRQFAEKYVQEGLKKYPPTHDLDLHYFGVLQSNKIRRVLERFAHVETIGRKDQADTIQRIASDLGPALVARRFFVQINAALEPRKNGTPLEFAPDLIEHCLALGLPVSGLMTIPPKQEPPAPYFKALRKLADDYGLPHCQMGFSNDYRIAIDCGATHLRIGTAIWGNKYSLEGNNAAQLAPA